MIFIISALIASFIAPLVVPFTGGALFYLLHEWFYPGIWGLPAIESIAGVSVNTALIGYCFMFIYGLPIALILNFFGKYQLKLLLAAGIFPSLLLMLLKYDWIVCVVVAISGLATSFLFWHSRERVHSIGLEYINILSS